MQPAPPLPPIIKAFVGPPDESALFTPQVMKACLPYARPVMIALYHQPLLDTMRRHSIITKLRMVHFLSQGFHECAGLSLMLETTTGIQYEGRKDLGNLEPGDGPKYKGRGMGQLTGKANYAAFQTFLEEDALDAGLNIVEDPSLVATKPILAVESFGWFWSKHKLNTLADEDNPHAITLAINGGLNGIQDRLSRLLIARKAFGMI